MGKVQYERPREKLQQRGARSLTNTELLQVIIGSGNAQVAVAKIAKKVAKVLEVNGSMVHPKELLTIKGMGNVKTGQIVALFELAARFPALSNGDAFHSKDSLSTLYQTLNSASRQTILYISFDGASRIIKQRTLSFDKSMPLSKLVQRIFADCLTDSAINVVIAVGYEEQSLDPELYELSFIRDAYKTSRFLIIPIRQLVLVSREGNRVLKEADI